MTGTKPEIRPFSGISIPQFLKDQKRWAPWKAVFNEKRGKYDKIPHNPSAPEYGISTADPEKWGTFDAALAAFKQSGGIFSGVGYVMTRPHGVIGIDLDNCIDEGGSIAPWALEILAKTESYTEVSPSGRGLRIFGKGEVRDWTNNQVGIEVYGGVSPRFLTITGTPVANLPREVRPLHAVALAEIRTQYARNVRQVEVEAADMPDLLPDSMVPDIASLDLMYYTRDFLTTGEIRGDDRSGELHAAAVALYGCGLDHDEVFTILMNNPYAMEVALDHRRQDSERASLYLWQEQCLKGKAKADARRVTADAFDDLSPVGEPVASETKPEAPSSDAAPSASGFDDISTPDEKAAKAQQKPKEQRFRVQAVGEFLKRPKANWFIKGVLPQASLTVVFGESGSGKTFYVLDMVAAIARGVSWRGKKTKSGRVVYICAEGESGFRNRLDAYCQFNNVAEMEMGVIGDAPNFMEKLDIKDLVAAVKTFGKTDIIVVDTFAQVMPGANENSGEDVGRALAHCKALHRVTGAMVVLVHHSGKDASKGARGWSGLRAAADAEIEIQRSRDNRSATITKLKDGEDGAEFGFTLTTVQTGLDDDQDPISSCVVAHNEVVAEDKDPSGARQKLVLDTFKSLLMGDESVPLATLVDAVVGREPLKNGKPPRADHIRTCIKGMHDEFLRVVGDAVFPK